MRPSSSARIACIASPRSGFNRFTSKRAILFIVSIPVFLQSRFAEELQKGGTNNDYR
jgi:hypothetical protein